MRDSLLEQFETFAFQFDVQRYESREVCIGSGKIRNKADIHNIARRADQNRNRRGGALGGECSRAAQATRTSTGIETSSAANSGKRSSRPSAYRYSMKMFLPSTHPSACNFSRNRWTGGSG